MRYYTTAQISEHIQVTPEGYLLCYDVPIARIGEQLYTPEEVPDVTPGADGTVRVIRTPEEVFAPAAIASYQGKSITVLHPVDPDNEDEIEFVNPENWKELSAGVALNVRRGAAEFAGLLLADLLIADAGAIEAVKKGLRQVSCGYDADTVEVAPGVGRQINIVGNHIAIVPKGRAGARCAIRDALTKEFNMPEKVKKKSFWDRFTEGIQRGKTADEAAKEAVRDEAAAPPAQQPAQPDGREPTTDDGGEVAALAAKLDELILLVRSLLEDPQQATDEAAPPDGTQQNADEAAEEEKYTKTGDAAARRPGHTRQADAETVRRAKTLAPHITARVGDSALAVKKASLRSAMADAEIKKVIDSCLSGQSLDAAGEAQLEAAFMASSTVMASANNRKTADAVTKGRAKTDSGAAAPITPEEINQRNREFYGKGGM